MGEKIRQVLAIDRSSTARERTVDITTTGRRTELQRRIEIWFHRVDGRYYLSTLPRLGVRSSRSSSLSISRRVVKAAL